jgi:hypothetical protein
LLKALGSFLLTSVSQKDREGRGADGWILDAPLYSLAGVLGLSGGLRDGKLRVVSYGADAIVR